MSLRRRLVIATLVFAAWPAAQRPLTGTQADTQPPSVSILHPQNNHRVGGKVTVSAQATDNVGVVEVRFLKNGTQVDTDTSVPFSAELDFNADAPNANYVVKAVAVDAAGNEASASVTVNKPNQDLAGIGASLVEDGAFFKLWAPHATSVALLGDFNAWNRSTHLLWKTGDWWFGFQPGVTVGQKYKFRINDSFEKPDPYGRRMENSAGASIVEDPRTFPWSDGAWKTPAFEDMIIYELHVGTFVGKNDGQQYPGNFKNLLTKLDYIKSIGTNMIEVLPVNEVPGPDGDTPYLGYAPTGIFAVESAYGPGFSPYTGFKEFVDTAHKKGLGVILDVVYNHFSDVSGRDNWYWNYDGDGEGGDGGIFFNGQNTEWGPAPDWGRQEVRQYVEDNCKYWLSEFHLDGLRWDVTREIKNKPNGWDSMRNIVWNVRQAFPGKIFIAENLPYEKAVVEAGNFHTGWYVDFHHKIQAAFQAGDNADLNDVKVGVNGGDYSHVTKRVIYAMSHDEARNGGSYLIDEFGGRGSWDSRAKSRTAAALMFMAPGIPMIFQGEEFAQNGWFTDDRDHAVNWVFEHDPDGERMKAMYQQATWIRWTQNALRRGSLAWTHEDHNNKVIAFRRDFENQNILVVVNFGSHSFDNHSYGVATGGVQGQWSQILCSQDAAFGGWDGAGNAFFEPQTQADGKIFINVPKFSVVAMRRK